MRSHVSPSATLHGNSLVMVGEYAPQLDEGREPELVERIFDAAAHECRIIIFDVHIEFADVPR